MGHEFDLEKPHYYEVWSDKEGGEYSLFSPEQTTKVTYKLLTHTVYDKPMICIANLKGTYLEAKIIYEEVIDQHRDNLYGMI